VPLETLWSEVVMEVRHWAALWELTLCDVLNVHKEEKKEGDGKMRTCVGGRQEGQ